MNSKHPDKDIDHIFKNAIDPTETEPSDKFWNRAFEDIIKRESKIYGKQVRRWKTISYMLGVVIILLAFCTFYIHYSVNKIEKQITEVEKKQAIAGENGNITGAATTNAGNKTELKLNKQVTDNHESKAAETATGMSNIVASVSENNYETVNKSGSAEQREPEGSARMNPNSSNPGSNNIGTDKNPPNSSYGFGNKMPPGNYYGDTTTGSSESTSNNLSTTTPSTYYDTSVTAQNTKPIVAEKKDTTITSLNETRIDTLAQAVQKSKSAGSKISLAHLYISGFFAPGLSYNVINTNNPSGNIIVDNIKSGEGEGATYTTGLKMGYDLSKHWSVLTGLYYHSSSFSILPTVVHAQWQGNTTSYSIVTSAGTVEMPYSVSQSANDSLKASGNSSRTYIGIPLQVRYDFLPGSNVDFYVEGGFTANILLQTQTNLNWESAWDEGTCHINNCDGLQNVFFVYNMGIGITFKIAKGFSIYIEPGMQGPITPASKNNPVTTYPYVLESAIGIIYHL